MIHFRVRFERLAEHLASTRRRTALWRAAWLALIVPCLGVAGAGLGLWHWLPGLWFTGAAVVFCLATWYGTRRAAGEQLGRWLDRRYHMDELLVTAVEVDRRGPRGAMETRLLDDAAMAVARLDRGPVADPRPVRREKETTAALGLLLAGLWLLAASSVGAGLTERLAPLPGSGDGLAAAGPGGGSAPSDRGPVAPGWSGMAAALGDQAAALGLAAALQRGEAAAAARAARALADQAPALSSQGRTELSEALRQAAKASSDLSLKAALEAAAQALSTPNTDTAVDAVERLAAAFDVRAAAPGTGLAMATPSAASRPGPPAQRLAGSGLPQSLGTAAPGVRAGPGGARAAGSAAGDAPLAPPRPVLGASGARVDAASGVDALAVPGPYRDLVRRYFARDGRAP
jgi:hypothetical protein